MFEIKPYVTLCRTNISLFTACSAATGFFLAPYHRITGVLLPAAAAFLLTCGASALNQYQEKDIDAKMERTRQRPLPSGIITSAQALSLALVLMISGLLLLVISGKVIATVLGLFAFLWYNGIYTHLKRITAFASVPGALVGAVPPAIGWSTAGGTLVDVRLFALCFVFIMWQIPHFWLLIIRRGEEYQKAGLPSLTAVMSTAQISRVTFVWIFSASVACLLLPLYGTIRSPLVYYSLIPPAAWLVWNGRALAQRQPAATLSSGLFKKINIYLFLIMSLLSLENIFFHVP
ncbi:MAG TPA: protoheme IX farnesyltransferase [Nitrospirota bacterium]|nr:protoheme IX farnesyltransferase [Nitrospirota bacterium]